MHSQFCGTKSWIKSLGIRKHGKRAGLIGGLLIWGLAGGFLLGSTVQYPTDLGAAVPKPPLSQNSTSVPAQGFAAIAKVVRPAVVHITVTKNMNPISSYNQSDSLRDFWSRDLFPFPESPRHFKDPRRMGMGSGVIVSPDGFIITNHHVVEGAETVNVRLIDKREFSANVIGSDPKTDMAVIKVDAEDLPYLTWGNSRDLQVGDYVLAVGNPFGLTSTVTQGIVSALGRGGMGITQYEDFIQTDAAINPGNSGGALVNRHGELVGINTAIFSRNGGYQGVGFAVPSDMAQPVYASLVKNGKVIRGFLGIGIQEMTQELAKTLGLEKAEGALVTDVKMGSPAHEAGIQRGDTIVAYRGMPVTDPRTLQNQVLRTPVGTEVSLLVVRDNQEQELHATIQEVSDKKQLAQAQEGAEESGFSGLTVIPWTNSSSHFSKNNGVESGVMVEDVKPGSPADQAGLSRGDVIREINRQPIKSLDDYYQATGSLGEDQRALLLVNRSGVPLFLTITL